MSQTGPQWARKMEGGVCVLGLWVCGYLYTCIPQAYVCLWASDCVSVWIWVCRYVRPCVCACLFSQTGKAGKEEGLPKKERRSCREEDSDSVSLRGSHTHTVLVTPVASFTAVISADKNSSLPGWEGGGTGKASRSEPRSESSPCPQNLGQLQASESLKRSPHSCR